jgi:hypothetical protein
MVLAPNFASRPSASLPVRPSAPTNGAAVEPSCVTEISMEQGTRARDALKPSETTHVMPIGGRPDCRFIIAQRPLQGQARWCDIQASRVSNLMACQG